MIAVATDVTVAADATAPTSVIDAPGVIADVPRVPDPEAKATEPLHQRLEKEVTELIDGWPWAPFDISIGIGSRDFMFAHASYAVEALAMAYPHLPPPLAEKAKALAAAQLPDCLSNQTLSLTDGRRRELYDLPPNDMFWPSKPDWPPISHLYAIWLYAHRTGDWDSVQKIWPQIRQVWADYLETPLRFEGKQNAHVYMNRTAAGLIAYARLARHFNAPVDADAATVQLQRVLDGILAYYRDRAGVCAKTLAEANQGHATGGQGRALYFPMRNHFLKLAIFLDMTPELAHALAAAEPDATATFGQYVDKYMPLYYLAWGERQVHYGENFVDLPDSLHGIFQAKTFLWDAAPEKLAEQCDLPWVKADLFHMEKLVYAIESFGRERR